MKYVLVSVVLLAACSSSSQKAAPKRVTTTTVADCAPARAGASATLTFGQRGYRLSVPASYDGTHKTPLVLVFHGFSSSKEAIDADTSIDTTGAARGFIVATPDGASNPKTWNFLPGKSGSTSDDYTFVADFLHDLEQHYCVDPDRVYATGHSAGSAFVGFLVCHAPYPFAAIANVSATIPSSCPANVNYALMSVHGTADTTVLYDGGLGQGQSVPIPPVKQTVAGIAARNGCNATPVSDAPAAGVERLAYGRCRNNDDVVLLTIVGGGHPWPGGLQATHLAPVVDGARYSATNAILEFFAAHRRSA